MDVVRRNIEAVHGRVEIASEAGAGTAISIHLPLTLAIIDGFTVRVAGESYVVPLESVLECLAFDEGDGSVCGVTMLRGEPLPFIRLRTWFERSAGFQPAATPASSRQDSSREPGRQDAGVAAGTMPALREPAPDLETRARLTTGIRAYLEGQYEVAVRVLDGQPFPGAAAAEAALFRAAARDALYRIGGEQDAALRAAVENDLRVYRDARPARKPDPRIFPPRFIAMAER
jgi:hypothetical protein